MWKQSAFLLFLAFNLQIAFCKPFKVPVEINSNHSSGSGREQKIADKRAGYDYSVKVSGDYVSLEDSSKLSSKTPIDSVPSLPTREIIKLEYQNNQALFERPKSKPIEEILLKIKQPDENKIEHDYMHSDEKLLGLRRTLVDGFEGFSNFLNTIVDFPKIAFGGTSRKLTEALNKIGARLIGLS